MRFKGDDNIFMKTNIKKKENIHRAFGKLQNDSLYIFAEI